MWPRLTSSDFRVIGHYLGTLVMMMGVVMLIPLAIAIILQETSEIGDFLIGVGSCLVLGNALRLLRLRPGKLTRQQALLVVGLSWLVLAAVSAIPLYASGEYATPFDALFDGISTLTTTGFSLSEDFDHMAISQQLWRVIMVFIGGQGVVVIALSLGFFGRSGGVGTVYRSEGRSEQVLPNVIQTTRFIWVVSGSMVLIATVIGTIISLGIGMSFWRSVYNGLYLAVSSYDTGGITPQSSSLIYYHSWAIEAFCAVFALVGVINFGMFLHFSKVHDDELRRNAEVRAYVIWISLAVICAVIVLMGDGYYTTLQSVIRRGLFMVINASTTAGLQTVYSDQFGLAFTAELLVILMLVMIIGGASGSTAGGIKAIRLAVIAKWFWLNIKKTLLPGSAIQHAEIHHFSNRKLTSELAVQAMIIFVLYVFTGVTGGMLGIAFGYDAVPAVFESFGCVVNTGISTGIIAVDMPLLLKIFYTLEMYAGRLEFIALIATIVQLCVSLFTWHPRKARERSRARAKVGTGAAVLLVCVCLIVSGVLPDKASAVTYDNEDLSSPYASQNASDEEASESSEVAINRTVGELVASESSYDGALVSFSGEAIGEPLNAEDGYKWVNVRGSGKLIGVYMTDAQVALIENWGKSGVKGTELKVTGTFSIACSEHGGDLDVHAAKVSVVSAGGKLPAADSSGKYYIGGVLIIVGLGLFLLYHRKLKSEM